MTPKQNKTKQKLGVFFSSHTPQYQILWHQLFEDSSPHTTLFSIRHQLGIVSLCSDWLTHMAYLGVTDLLEWLTEPRETLFWTCLLQSTLHRYRWNQMEELSRARPCERNTVLPCPLWWASLHVLSWKLSADCASGFLWRIQYRGMLESLTTGDQLYHSPSFIPWGPPGNQFSTNTMQGTWALGHLSSTQKTLPTFLQSPRVSMFCVPGNQAQRPDKQVLLQHTMLPQYWPSTIHHM